MRILKQPNIPWKDLTERNKNIKKKKKNVFSKNSSENTAF